MVLCSLLLVGCDETCAHPAGCDAPAEDTDLPDTDTDLPDTDTDTDTDPPCTDTGLGQLYISGSIQTRGGEFEAATVGYSVYGAAIDDWACVIEGSVAYEDPAPEGCPDCYWAFDLGPVEGAVATGPRCDTIGLADGTVNAVNAVGRTSLNTDFVHVTVQASPSALIVAKGCVDHVLHV
jgi:hypothetical protein